MARKPPSASKPRPPRTRHIKGAGFSVGPVYLPNGTYKWKVTQIKKDLISSAKIKKQYAKVKAREEASAAAPKPGAGPEGVDGAQNDPTEPVPEPSLEPHPDRLKMLKNGSPGPEPEPEPEATSSHYHDRRRRRPRSQPFRKEAEFAQKKKEEADARRKAHEEAEKERTRKVAERERLKKVVSKARSSGPNGQQKLGRESTVLLEKAKRLVGKN